MYTCFVVPALGTSLTNMCLIGVCVCIVHIHMTHGQTFLWSQSIDHKRNVVITLRCTTLAFTASATPIISPKNDSSP